MQIAASHMPPGLHMQHIANFILSYDPSVLRRGDVSPELLSRETMWKLHEYMSPHFPQGYPAINAPALSAQPYAAARNTDSQSLSPFDAAGSAPAHPHAIGAPAGSSTVAVKTIDLHEISAAGAGAAGKATTMTDINAGVTAVASPKEMRRLQALMDLAQQAVDDTSISDVQAAALPIIHAMVAQHQKRLANEPVSAQASKKQRNSRETSVIRSDTEGDSGGGEEEKKSKPAAGLLASSRRDARTPPTSASSFSYDAVGAASASGDITSVSERENERRAAGGRYHSRASTVTKPSRRCVFPCGKLCEGRPGHANEFCQYTMDGAGFCFDTTKSTYRPANLDPDSVDFSLLHNLVLFVHCQ
jgi:hypothetical protein